MNARFREPIRQRKLDAYQEPAQSRTHSKFDMHIGHGRGGALSFAAVLLTVIACGAYGQTRERSDWAGVRHVELVAGIDIAVLISERYAGRSDEVLSAAVREASRAEVDAADSLLPVFIATLRRVAGRDALPRYFSSLGSSDAGITAAMRAYVGDVMRRVIEVERARMEATSVTAYQVDVLSDHAVRVRHTGPDTNAVIPSMITHPGVTFNAVVEDRSAPAMLARAMAPLRVHVNGQDTLTALCDHVVVSFQPSRNHEVRAVPLDPKRAYPRGVYMFTMMRSTVDNLRRSGMLERIQSVLPDSVALMDGGPLARSIDMGDPTEDEPVVIYLVRRAPAMRCGPVKQAVALLSEYSGLPETLLELSDVDAPAWKKLTRSSIGRRIAIVSGDRVLSAPVVQSEIPGGYAAISSGGGMRESEALAIALRGGGLPAPLRLISVNVRN